MYESQVAVGISSEVLVLSLCTSFLMSVVGSLCGKRRIQQSPSRLYVQLVNGVQKCDS